jgi:S1-C subfamily serine protease
MGPRPKGFPFGEAVLITNAGVVASAWQMNQRTQVPGAEGFHTLDLADAYWIDGQANPGNSGGPVYRVEDASVIGVCVGTRMVPVEPLVVSNGRPVSYSSGLTTVVPSRYVSELMTTNGIR